jgi:hypothetical protein
MNEWTIRQARGATRRVMALLAVLAVSLPLTIPMQAQAAQAGEWEQLRGLPGPVSQLFAPTSGALFARVGTDLHRSDDGGATWQAVALPALTGTSPSRRIAVDPTNHQRIYATGTDGLYRTVDDAASWQLIWPNDPDFPVLLGFAASPAAPDTIYVVVGSRTGHIMQMARSDDGGQSWTTLETNGHQHLACTWSVYLLRPHPTDPDRVFRAFECSHALAAASLQESRDRGQHWDMLADTGGGRPETVKDPLTNPPPAPTPAPTGTIVTISGRVKATGTAGRLIGGEGAMPGRYYLVVTRPAQGGGMSLLRSDDDGTTWVEQLSYSGGGGMTAANDPNPDVTIRGLAMDPQSPDRLYATFRSQVKGQPETFAVRTSADGGATWTDLPLPGSDAPGDLVLGIDSRNLYVAGTTGIWRLAL